MPIVKNEHIVERWHVQIDGADGNAEAVLKNTEELIGHRNPPNVKVQRKKISPGILRGALGDKREFVVVTETKTGRLKPYQMLINARDYGKTLDISWYLLFKLSIWRKVLVWLLMVPVLNLFIFPFFLIGTVVRGKKAGLDLDMFDEQDLRAYTTVAHHSMKEAVEKMMADLNKDSSRIDWKSQGFLGIS